MGAESHNMDLLNEKESAAFSAFGKWKFRKAPVHWQCICISGTRGYGLPYILQIDWPQRARENETEVWFIGQLLIRLTRMFFRADYTHRTSVVAADDQLFRTADKIMKDTTLFFHLVSFFIEN